MSENDGCGVDSVHCIMSCTVGKGNMILRPRGKNAFSFFDRDTGRSVRVVLRPFDRNGEREEVIRRVLEMPLEDLFDFKEPGFPLPERARMFENRTCEICGESAREDMMRFRTGRSSASTASGDTTGAGCEIRIWCDGSRTRYSKSSDIVCIFMGSAEDRVALDSNPLGSPAGCA